MTVLIKSARGSDELTKAAFALLHANASGDAGHEVGGGRRPFGHL